MNLGDTVRQLRMERGLTQPELAAKAQIEQSYLSKLENDKGTPSFDIINRIAIALGLSGMELIGRLSHSYIEERLGHMPEVAVEYASIRQKLASGLKLKFMLAALLVILGLGFGMAGSTALFFSEVTFEYSSLGVIRAAETLRQFDTGLIREINERPEEAERRLLQNRGRIDEVFLLSRNYKGQSFVEAVPDGRRYYALRSPPTNEKRWENKLLVVLGALLAATGGFLLYFTRHFKPVR